MSMRRLYLIRHVTNATGIGQVGCCCGAETVEIVSAVIFGRSPRIHGCIDCKQLSGSHGTLAAHSLMSRSSTRGLKPALRHASLRMSCITGRSVFGSVRKNCPFIFISEIVSIGPRINPIAIQAVSSRVAQHLVVSRPCLLLSPFLAARLCLFALWEDTSPFCCWQLFFLVALLPLFLECFRFFFVGVRFFAGPRYKGNVYVVTGQKETRRSCFTGVCMIEA